MGTQQILLIVLSVIIVGVAIAVGITMFNNQAYNSNQQAVAGELQNYGSQAVQYWKTPISQGGAGQTANVPTTALISAFIGFNTGDTLTTENGVYKVNAYDQANKRVTLIGIGNNNRAGKYPMCTTTVNLDGGIISTVVGTDADGHF
jgi:hypothetical protein